VLTVATPATNGTVTGPDGKPTVTVPVGVHAAGATGDTVTVNVTGAQHTDGFGDTVTVVVVPARVTTGVTDPVEELKQPSPPYTAVTAPDVGVSALVVTVAAPPTNATVCGTPLIVTVTDPVGVHVAGATGDTVTVNVTGWQHTDGLGAAVIVVVVLALLTVWVSVPVEELKQLSPL
jgi:hypothetical protein